MTETSSPDLKIAELTEGFNAAKQAALEEEVCFSSKLHFSCEKFTDLFFSCLQFDRTKMGEADISNSFRERLSQNLDNFNVALSKTLEIFNERLNHYTNSMQSSLDQVEYYQQDDFVKLHQRVKSEAISQVCHQIIQSKSIYLLSFLLLIVTDFILVLANISIGW